MILYKKYPIFRVRKRPDTAAAKNNVKGPMGVLMFKSRAVSQKTTLAMARRKTSIQDSCVTDARDLTIQYIAQSYIGIVFLLMLRNQKASN